MRSHIDFLDEKDKLVAKPKKKKLRLISKIIIYLLIIGGILFVSSTYGIITSGEHLAQTFGNVSLWGQIKHLISSDSKKIAGQDEDRINILLLGIGGENHDGPYLTDTNIIVSFKPSTKQVALISIPRDLLVPIPNYGWLKINHADAYGELANPGRGGELSSQVVSNVFNIPIHYYVRIDFSGFKQIVDDLGGITVNVENTLDDPMYPVAGKENATTTQRYEHLYIKPGQQYLNGSLALKFVRSRHALGIEGSDFARSKRQQKVLMAIKDKGLSFGTLINPYKISRVMDTLSQHLATNLQVWEIIELYNLGRNIDEQNIINRVVDDSPDGPLYDAITEQGAFVLKPKAGNFSELQEIAQNIFNYSLVEEEKSVTTNIEPKKVTTNTNTNTSSTNPTIAKPKKIEIQNGTKINGLASRTALYLKSLGYQIVKMGNAPTQDYQKTVIYNLSTDSNNKTAENIAKLLDSEVASALPDWVTSTSTRKVSASAEVLIILGQDRQDL
ncbi:MAG: LCP family protein [Patescibacteria group bacterium]